MRECKIIIREKPSTEGLKIANKLVDELIEIEGQIMDKDCKNAIRSIRSGTHLPKYNRPELRIDSVYGNKVGVVSSMGTTAIISRRMLSALHYYNSGTISEIIFIAHSEINAWYQNNCTKSKRVNGNGNRATSHALLGLIDDLNYNVNLPIIVIEITDKESMIEYEDYEDFR